MEIDRKRTLRAASFAVVVVMLTAICVGLAAMVAITTQGAKQADGAARAYFYRMAWLSLALLALSVIVLVWVVIHHVSGRLGRKSPHPPTEYVDAWALAGKRFKLEEDEEDSDQQEPT